MLLKQHLVYTCHEFGIDQDTVPQNQACIKACTKESSTPGFSTAKQKVILYKLPNLNNLSLWFDHGLRFL